ncbi:MAG: deoxynucleoside kinase [Candidatus Hadarchaeota archaeon]
MPNIFLIGRPGCGKSAVFRAIEKKLRDSGFKGEFKRIDDFPILKNIFDTDTEHKRSRPAPGGGLKVTDDTVWDDLIKGLDKQALEFQRPDRLLFIEFSRDSYVRAFKNFSPKVMENSLIIYINASFEACWARNVRRVQEERERGLDSHLVSREEMEKTYSRDDYKALQKHVKIPVLIAENENADFEKREEEVEKVISKVKGLLDKDS